MTNVVMVSGGFDPIHPGHLRMIQQAAKLGKVVVALNSDEWLIRKKGFTFQDWDARAELLCALKYVADVVRVDDADGTVCEAIEVLRPNIFVNGGDRGVTNTPELELCRTLGIAVAFGVGGDYKFGSSSAIAARRVVQRKWGSYEVLFESPWCKVKHLIVEPGVDHTAQRHFHREEYWFDRNGGVYHIPLKTWHRIHNPLNQPREIIEVQLGDCREDDVERR